MYAHWERKSTYYELYRRGRAYRLQYVRVKLQLCAKHKKKNNKQNVGEAEKRASNAALRLVQSNPGRIS